MTFQDHRKNATDFVLAQISPRATGQSEYQRKTPLRDKVFSVLALLLTSPILVIMTLCIVIAGQNPLFVQERIGQYCRTFRIFKFQTIPQEGWAAAEAAAQTPVMRAQLFLFLKVSRILRKTGLDELPQFVNILRGDMQIIGPRPLVAKDFDALPEGREVRCMVLPGITGLAQINGGQDLDPHSKLALDLYVIDHLSVR
ncbi:MAG: sugar transferase, partial [Paracoccaceae bacterium]